MIVELMGCTGAGKSTLSASLRRACWARRIEVWTGDEFVLDRIHLGRVPGHVPRTVLVDLCALTACLAAWRRRQDVLWLALRIIRDLPPGVYRDERLNLARNVLKKVGIYEIAAARGHNRLVLVDEGTLQAAHNLFVHLSVPPCRDAVAAFARLVPLPDLAIYVADEPTAIVERTLQRGHRRIAGPSRANVECFVGRAIQTFDWLVDELVAANRLAPLDGSNRLFARPGFVPNGTAPLVEILRGDGE